MNFIDYKIIISKLETENDPQKITKLKRNIFQSISMIPDSLMRTEYCRAYHNKLNIEEGLMLKEILKIRKGINVNTQVIKNRNTVKEKKPLVEENDLKPSNQLNLYGLDTFFHEFIEHVST